MKKWRLAGRKSRSVVLSSCLAAAALTVSACGGDAASTTDGADQEEVTEADIEEARAFFEGETITFVVDRSPGGGYDTYARMVAPYLADELGADIVVENQPGAGGLVAMNNLYATEPDGLTIATFNAAGLIPAVIGGFPGAEFDPTELTWLGRMGGEPDVLVTGSGSGIETWDDVLAGDGLVLGGTGPGASDFVYPVLLTELFDIDGKIVSGFDGSSELELALLRGDIDLQTGSADSRIETIENGDTGAIVVFANERLDILPDTPTIFEQDLTDEQEQVMQTHVDVKDLGRPVVAPPGLGAARTQVLREALMAALQNPDLIAEAEEQGRPIDALSGEEQQERVASLTDAPERYREVLEKAFANVGELEE